VTIADGFWMFDTSCTEALWEAVTGNAPEPRRGAGFPVTGVSWTDAQDFIRQLNATKPGLGLSLPSEARWEYACRADTITPYTFGTGISRDLVCYNTDAPVPAGSLPPNGWGLHEMHGNVWEWCADYWHDSYAGAPRNGSAWLDRKDAALRVVRGGSWADDARNVRAAFRDPLGPADRLGDVGFRCARVQSDSEERQAQRRAGRSKPSERSETAATTSPNLDTGGNAIEAKRAEIISALADRLGTALIRKRGVYFWNASHDQRVVCTISKRYHDRPDLYWFRYDTDWRAFLAERGGGYLLLGCMGLPYAFAIPYGVMDPLLEKLHTTSVGGRLDFWHLNIIETVSGSYALALPRSQAFPLDPYRIRLT
jgi:hypothetical protein